MAAVLGLLIPPDGCPKIFKFDSEDIPRLEERRPDLFEPDPAAQITELVISLGRTGGPLTQVIFHRFSPTAPHNETATRVARWFCALGFGETPLAGNVLIVGHALGTVTDVSVEVASMAAEIHTQVTGTAVSVRRFPT